MINSKTKVIIILCMVSFIFTVIGFSQTRLTKTRLPKLTLKKAAISEIHRDECYGLGTNTSQGFEVVGQNFGVNPGITEAFMNNVLIQHSNAMWSNFTIQVIAPESVVKLGVKNIIYLKRNKLVISNKKAFIPWGYVQSVTPDKMDKQKSGIQNIKKFVKVQGFYLGGTQGVYRIYFGKTLVSVVSWQQNNPPEQIITVSIPNHLPKGKHIVRVKRKGILITNPAVNTPVFEYK